MLFAFFTMLIVSKMRRLLHRTERLVDTAEDTKVSLSQGPCVMTCLEMVDPFARISFDATRVDFYFGNCTAWRFF